jgi:hypothetical protein
MFESISQKIQFIERIDAILKTGQSFKITFSKPRPENKEFINVYVRPALIKKQIVCTLTYRFSTKDETKNIDNDQLTETAESLLGTYFFNAVLISGETEWTLLQNKKEKSSLVTKKLRQEVNIETTHDHAKIRIIPSDSLWLKKLGLSGKDGKILDKSQDKFRQINKYVEIIDHIIRDFPMHESIKIADMGSGKGYLTFALYDHLAQNKNMQIHLTGYEIRKGIVDFCNKTAKEIGFEGLDFVQNSINEADVTGTDMVIALHACDIATDMAIAKGIQAGAAYIIVSPCCHKQIRNAMNNQSLLSPILRHGILTERQAEIITDGIRALIMEAYGYKTQVFEFISTEHTSKNLMITGIKSKPNPSAMKQIEDIKQMFGIDYHYLEKLLNT